MKNLRFGILVLITLFFCPILTSAETIILKSGRTIEGKLIEKTDKYIKIEFQEVALTYFLDEIESIDGQKQIVVRAQEETVSKSQINEISQDSARLDLNQEENSEQSDFTEAISTSVLEQELPSHIKPVMQQTQKYAIGQERQTSKALLPLFALGGAFGIVLFIIIIVFSLVNYIYGSICLQFIAKKTSQEPAWLAWIPIANLFLCCKIGGLSYLWLLVIFAVFIPIIGSLCFTAFVAYLWYRIAIALNKPGWLGALCIIPIVSLVIMGYLAFSKD